MKIDYMPAAIVSIAIAIIASAISAAQDADVSRETLQAVIGGGG